MRRLALGGTFVVAAWICVGAALGARGFVDRPGDENAAPDITALEVSEPSVGTLALRVGIGNFPVLPSHSWVNLWFDTDRDQRTGDAGDEALIRYSTDGGLELFAWDGTRLVQRSVGDLTASYDAGSLRISVSRASLAANSGFGLLAVTSRRQPGAGDAVVASDFAPDVGRSDYTGAGPTAVSDPTGDQDAAPDITSVRVSDARNGWITFAVSTPNYTALPPEAVLAVLLDVDDNPRTGEAGTDAVLGIGGGEIALERWEPRSGWLPDDLPTRARTRQGAGVVFVDVHVSELDNTRRFAFVVAAFDVNTAEQQVVGLDLAPDTGSPWRYVLTNKAAVQLTFTKIVTKPARPRAGKPFTVGFSATRSDTGRGVSSGAVGCRVLTGERRVLARGRIAGGAGLCSFVVPKSAVGSVIRGTVTVRSGGAVLARDFAFVVL